MTKSTPSTTTTVNQNPVGQMQAGYLQNAYNNATYLSDINGTNANGPVGQDYLSQIQTIGQNAANATGWMGSALPNEAGAFTQTALTGGTPQSWYAGGPQIGGLNSLSGQAVGAGLNYAGQIGNAANYTPGAIAPYATGLRNLSGAAANVANPSEAALMANSGMAISGNPVFSSGLMGAASGQYIDPNRNPALAGTIQAATQPLVNQYQTATAPQTDSGFEAGGRYGSGAMTNARGQNQYALGSALANATSQIVNNSYNTGLNAMLGAGSTLGSAYNTGVSNANQGYAAAGGLGQSGISNAGNLLQQGGALDLSSLQAMMGGLGTAGQTANAGYGTGGGMLNNAGQLANTGQISLGGLAQAAPSLADYPQSQLSTAYNTNWAPVQNAAAIFGSPIGGNTMTTQTTPYYTNVGQQAMSGLTSAATIAALLKI